MTPPVKLAVLGAGMIGTRHIEHVLATQEAQLAAIVDPAPAAKDLAAAKNAPWHPSLTALLAAGRPDGVICATPNQMHVAHGLEAIDAGVPALIEKPIADDVASAQRLVDAAERAGVPILVGHHRRHNPLIRKAKAIIDSGRLGKIIAVHGACWFMKPDEYFDAAWRRQKGAGPVFLNLIHDVDLLRHLCGEIAAVQALESSRARRHDVEDTAVILLRFASGALGAITVSDTIVAPWSWELTTGENPAYPHTDQSCYQIGGTHGSLSVPKLETWFNPAKRGWWEPMHSESVSVTREDPLRLQVRHFCRVIRGEEPPLVSGREGLNTLKVIAAVKEAARTGETVALA
jgi:predicted dehydrogenase